MKRFLGLTLVIGIVAASLLPALAASTTTNSMMAPTATVIKSCLNNYTLHAAFTAAELHSLGRPDATPANVNDVPLHIYGSYKYSDHIGCFYQSAHKDIFNLVYNFPCINPQPANNGDPYAYRCKR